jgi:hypothetical protein
MSEARDPREEAERLIASVLGSASVAAEGLSGFATGSAECCVCPVCRAIAAAREPNPQVAERLASGAGDLAAGVASMLRAFAGNFPGASRPAGTSTATSTDDDPWHTATRAAEAEATGASEAAAPAEPPPPPKPMAKKATKPKAEPQPGEES